MSIEVLKQELSALNTDQQRQMTAFLVSLQDSRNAEYREKLARKIDQSPSKFASLEELDNRLNLSDGPDNS